MKNFLDFIPVKWNKNVTDRIEKDRVTIIVQNKGFINRIAQIFFKRSKTTTIDFDTLSGFVWRRIDGKSSVYDIALDVEQKFGCEAEPIYDRLVKFMQILNSAGLIKFNKEGNI